MLKAPKTESSNRTIYLPQAVITELRTVKAQQEQYKAMRDEEYRDYDLVIAQINGGAGGAESADIAEIFL